jgi:hypothetical protein
MNITRKCKKCARLNIEAEIKIFIPFNNDQPDAFDVWDLIDCGEETGVYYCRDCFAIVETEVVQT